MQIQSFIMEEWFSKYRTSSSYNLADSGVQDYTTGEMFTMCNEDIEVLNQLTLGYLNPSGSPKLRANISKTYSSVNPEDILVTTSTSEAIFIVLNQILNPGDTVIVEFPAFQSLYEVPRAFGCNVKFLDLKPEEKFKPNLSRLEKLIDNNTKLIIINNPHNPSGATLNSEEFMGICKIVDKYGIYLLADEHYRFLPLDTNGTVPSMVDIYEKTIGVGSLTKCFGMIGLRVGWLISRSRELLQKCKVQKDYITHTLSPITDFISTMVLNNRDIILKKNIQMIKKNMTLFENFVTEYSEILSWIAPKGGAVCFPKYNMNKSSNLFCKELIEQEDVFLLPGSCFEKEGYFRMCLAVNDKFFAEAMNKFGNYLR